MHVLQGGEPVLSGLRMYVRCRERLRGHCLRGHWAFTGLASRRIGFGGKSTGSTQSVPFRVIAALRLDVPQTRLQLL